MKWTELYEKLDAAGRENLARIIRRQAGLEPVTERLVHGDMLTLELAATADKLGMFVPRDAVGLLHGLPPRE